MANPHLRLTASTYIQGADAPGPGARTATRASGMKNYELWKTQRSDAKWCKALKLEYDYAPKDHLTKASRRPEDYATQSNLYHGKSLTIDPSARAMDRAVHSKMKKANFNYCGERGNSHQASQELLSSCNRGEYARESGKLQGSPAGRRADPSNPNRVQSLTFGTKQYPQGSDGVDLSKAELIPDETKRKKQDELTNKFEYGLDSRGGIAARAGPVHEGEFQRCLGESARNHTQSIQNKELIERQNFTIKPEIELLNSETKYIGQQPHAPAERVDFSDLKRSHLPLSATETAAPGRTYGSNQGAQLRAAASYNRELEQLRKTHKTTKVPFAPQQRNRVESNYQKFDKLNGYGNTTNMATFKWKIPKYDLNL